MCAITRLARTVVVGAGVVVGVVVLGALVVADWVFRDDV